MDTVSRLKTVPLFAALSPENLVRVAQIAARQYYSKGQLLCRQDQTDETLFVIDRGEVILRQIDLQDVEKPITVLSEGQSVGDDALILGESCGLSAQALTDVEALVIHRKELLVLFDECPGLQSQLTIRPLLKQQLRTRSLAGQDPQEPWLLRCKRHWVALLRRLTTPAITFLALLAVALFLRELAVVTSPWLLVPFVGLLPVAMLIWAVVDWQNDYYLVTTKRLVYQEQVLLRSHTVDEVPLIKIQSYTINRQLLGNLLGYGTLQIRTAGNRGPIVLDYLHDPEGMQAVIFRQAGHLLSKQRTEERDQIRQELQRLRLGEPASTQLPDLPPAPNPLPRPNWRARLMPSRPLLRLSYAQADRVVWRRHWIFLVRHIFLPLSLLLLISAAIVWAAADPRLSSQTILTLASFLMWLAAAFWVWWEWTDWRNDEYIVTDDSIIDIDKKPLFFSEQRKKASLQMIQSLSLKKPGLLAALLNFGDVLIQTAGPEGTFAFSGVHNPIEVQREVFRRIEAYQEACQRRDRARKRAELATWFQVHDELPPTPSSQARSSDGAK